MIPALGRIDGVTIGAQCVRECILSGGFTMYEMYARCAASVRHATTPYRVQPTMQLSAVAVGAVAIEDFHLGGKLDVVAQHANHRTLLDDAAAQRVLGLETDDQDRVARIARALLQVMENATRFRHA
jgi:hypothetical protein